MSIHPGAARLVADRMADILRPRPPIRVSDWVAQNVVLVDGPSAGNLWSAQGAPYLVDILDCLSDDHPCNLVTVRKSQQTGASIAALAWLLYIADREPANLLYVAPGIDMLRDINSAKLQPLIDAWQRRTGERSVIPQTSRSGVGSTTYEKVFARGGRAWLGNANSVMDLSSKTAKKGVKDELSKWQVIPGAQDPEDLFFGRFTAFRGTRDWKILEISTPELDTGDPTGEAAGHCRIDRSFKRSDQRFWHIRCPECQTIQYQTWTQFRVDDVNPARSRYVCEGCGHEISEPERRIALQPEAGAHWLATADGPDRHPGFHIDAFCSLMMSYEAIAEDYIKARSSEIGIKGFHNLVLGLPFQYRGDAPDHEKLMERREAHLMAGQIPADALLLTAMADVQMRGIWLEIVAWTRDGRSYTVDARYLAGDTDTPDSLAFDGLLRQTLDRRFPDAFGGHRRIDALGVDTGYRSHVCYQWVRAHQTMHPDTGQDVVFALKGDEGWGKPAISMPTLQDIDLGGRKLRQGVRLWKVGTWPLKASVYQKLGRSRIASNFDEIPAGYCHFGAFLDEEYFKQLTAEALYDHLVRGVPAGKRWRKIRADNHFLDCRVGNLALAEHLGLSTMTEDQWSTLAAHRGIPAETMKTLFSPPATESPLVVERSEVTPPPRPPASDWLGTRTQNWF